MEVLHLSISALLLIVAGTSKAARDVMGLKPEQGIWDPLKVDPRTTWVNNEHKSPQWLWDGVLSWTGDPWHMVETIHLTSYEMIAALLFTQAHSLPWYWVFIGIALMKIIRGLAFEATFKPLFTRKDA